jgi:hypothetical protein
MHYESGSFLYECYCAGHFPGFCIVVIDVYIIE